MRVLAGCEESGKIRDSFRRLGHEAYSCDLEESRGEFVQFHWRMDIVECLERMGDFDLIILCPDCTAMATSGNHCYGDYKPRHAERLAAIRWTKDLIRLAKTKTKRLAVENPRSVIWSYVSGRVQWIHPWMFGHHTKKHTGLLLWNLPELIPTNDVSQKLHTVSRFERERVYRLSPDDNRKRDRAETFQGVADAMAAQWGIL